MKHTLALVLLVFGSFGAFADEEKTIVCVLEGRSNEYINSYNSRPVKVTQTIKFNDSNVTSFNHNFLTDNDFYQESLWDYGFKANKLDFESSMSDDEITISITEKENHYQHIAKNVFVNSVRYKLTINRKSGIGKVEGSLAYTIHKTPVGTSPPTLEEIKASPSDFYNMRYSAYGECTKGKNKF